MNVKGLERATSDTQATPAKKVSTQGSPPISPVWRPSAKIRDRHWERLAIVYVRQSSPHQVLENRESRERQYALATLAQQFGWPADRVLLIDEDQGISGRPTSTPCLGAGCCRIESARGDGHQAGTRTSPSALAAATGARTQYESQRAERQYQSVEPENRLVARTLEQCWEEALRQERQLREEYDRFLAATPVGLSDSDAERIRTATQNISTLWHAAETTPKIARQSCDV